MEYKPELEEREVFQYKGDCPNKNMDPNISLSYIDEKIQNVLAHFQRDFEGEVSTMELVAKYGQYGSFLHSYTPSFPRSSPRSHPKTQERNCSTQKTAHESPTSILKVMTSFPVPGGAIVSPFHENLHCLKNLQNDTSRTTKRRFLVSVKKKKNICMMRRNLKELHDDQNGLDSTRNDEDSSGSGLKKDETLRDYADIYAPIPAYSQTATINLEKAKTLRDYADMLKGLGFGLQSNGTNFRAARKFLYGASLLEASNEVGRQGEMTQIQAYSITAELCECSAVEYERRCKMAAAALAYKCLEVALRRIVYCKNSMLSSDRNEFKACLQTSSRGDDLNNQAIVDKATVSKGTIPHVSGSSIIIEDVNSAVEASRKSQNAYLAAKALEEAQNKGCIILVKKVIDFSFFQDVEEFLLLVEQAMVAIICEKLDNVRE
ncbi:cysteine-tryptophan domain-containing zinc finger protein 7-like isoform X2 [Euphorbia lathyris]|uniref:cysteine-tryptophan domain-containing zinc finger protein 7-like isoform X2 n=1 Tax=Euphorbia lathyris TaxID=212925 RepID=UPI003314027C